MRKIEYIVVHCTATQPEAKVSAIQNYWRNVLGWKNPGYHYLVESNGNVVQLLAESEVSNGVAGWNSKIINVSYIGGIDRMGKPFDSRTTEQKASLFKILKELKARYPQAKIMGHRDFPGVKKACPSFDAIREYLLL